MTVAGTGPVAEWDTTAPFLPIRAVVDQSVRRRAALLAVTFITTGLATLLVTAIQVNLVRATPGWTWMLWICCALLSSKDAAGPLFGRFTNSLDPELRRDLEAALRAGLTGISNFTGVKPEDLGIRVFVLTGDRLTHLIGWRPGTSPSMHNPRWKRGKGVVGRALVLQELVVVDWKSFYEKAVVDGHDAWEARSADDRFGLDWSELKETEDYHVIAARPISDLDRDGHNKVFGVIALDAQNVPFETIARSTLEGHLRVTGNLVLQRYQISKGSRWRNR